MSLSYSINCLDLGYLLNAREILFYTMAFPDHVSPVSPY